MSGHWISLTPLCSRCGKPMLRWCPRNRPGKTKMRFIILLPIIISSCPVAAKPKGPEKSPGAGRRHRDWQGNPACSVFSSLQLAGEFWGAPGNHYECPGAQESHQSCSNPCSANTAAAASPGRDEGKQQSQEERGKTNPGKPGKIWLDLGRTKPCFSCAAPSFLLRPTSQIPLIRP